MEHPRDQIYTPEIAQIVQRDYVCANCWGHLLNFRVPDIRDVRVECHQCGDRFGFVTRYFVEQEKSNDIARSIEARQLLQKLGVIENPHADKTSDQLIKELGFN